eukprot:COSAG06_NODE_17274_length_951_cov_1.231221_1_plen_51_part_00
MEAVAMDVEAKVEEGEEEGEDEEEDVADESHGTRSVSHYCCEIQYMLALQ